MAWSLNITGCPKLVTEGEQSMCKGMGGLFPSGASEPGGSAEERSLASEQARIPDGRLQTGALIINADDWDEIAIRPTGPWSAFATGLFLR